MTCKPLLRRKMRLHVLSYFGNFRRIGTADLIVKYGCTFFPIVELCGTESERFS